MPVRLWLFSLCLIAASAAQWMLLVGSLWAQADLETGATEEDPASWRYDLFQLLLEERKLKVERSLKSIIENAEKSVVVVGNDGNNLIRSISARQIVNYVESGGAVLLMHELNGPGRADRMVLDGFGMFHKGPVWAVGSDDAYQGFPDCVRVTRISDREGILAGIETLITNRAGWFQPIDSSAWQWEAVATFPTATMPMVTQSKHLLWFGRPTNGSQGMAIVLSDSSLLTNNMLWHGDNSRLALRLCELFQQQGRDRFHMLRNNVSLDSVSERIADQLRQEQARMQPPLPKPKPTVSQMLDLANVVAKEVIDSNVLNEALQRQPRHMSAERYFRILIILLIAAAMFYILWKILTSRSLRELWFTRRRQRHAYEIQAGNEAGDYRTAASYLAQEFCIQWTGSYHSRQWQQALATLMARMPSVTPADRHELTRIVDIASRGCHERMLAPDFQKLGKSLEMLRRNLITSATA